MMSSARDHLVTDCYRFLGHDLCVRSNSPEVLEHLRSVYARFRVEGPAASPSGLSTPSDAPAVLIDVEENIEDAGELVIRDPDQLHRLRCTDIRTFDLGYYTFALTVPDPMTYVQWLVLENVARAATDYQLFHAASLAWDGQAMILPGASGHGKTTLSLKLAARGGHFLSDEVAAVRLSDHAVAPFPRKLNVSDHSRQLLGEPAWPAASVRTLGEGATEWVLDIEEVAPAYQVMTAPLSYVVFLQGFGETPRLEPLSRTRALFRLFSFSLAMAERPAGRVFDFALLLERAQCFNLVAGDLDPTADLLLSVVNRGRGAA